MLNHNFYTDATTDIYLSKIVKAIEFLKRKRVVNSEKNNSNVI